MNTQTNGKLGLLLFFALATASGAVTAHAGSTEAGEPCTQDSECKGHCYTRKTDNKKVCVDCSSSSISTYRGRVEQYCKSEPRSCKGFQATQEVSEEIFESRIELGDECIKARANENDACWDGGDDGHQQAVKEAEKARKTCYDEWNTRKSNGFLYDCSDSTYSSKARYADQYCSAYGSGCQQWSKNDEVVDCDDIEDVMEDVDDCVDSIESLDSSCLPRLSRVREGHWAKAKESFDYCKEVLQYKKSKDLCD